MNAEFQDLEDRSNPLNGARLNEASSVIALLNELGQGRPPFMVELIGENESTLTVGISPNLRCAMYGPAKGAGPWYMAVGRPESPRDAAHAEFLVGGTATPIDERYCVSTAELAQIVDHFMDSGEQAPMIGWEAV